MGTAQVTGQLENIRDRLFHHSRLGLVRFAVKKMGVEISIPGVSKVHYLNAVFLRYFFYPFKKVGQFGHGDGHVLHETIEFHAQNNTAQGLAALPQGLYFFCCGGLIDLQGVVIIENTNDILIYVI